MRRFRHHPLILVMIGYAVVVVLLFRRAILPLPGWLLFGDDIHRSYYFFREFFNVWVQKGIFPWWNPYLFGGQPFIADPIVNIWYPLNWLFIVFPLNVAYSWHAAFHVVWAMTGMYVFGKQITEGGEQKNGFSLGAWVGGVVFGLSGFFMARTWSGHVDVIAAASWMPWVVWAFLRVISSQFAARSKPEDQKNIIWAAVIFAVQLISGYQTMAFMTVMTVGCVSIVYGYREKSWKPIMRAALAGIAGVGLAAFHLVPVQEFFLQSIRTYALPYSWVSYGAWKIESLKQMLYPFIFGDQRLYNGPPPNFGEHSAFVGISGLALAFFGIISCIRRKREWTGMGIAFLIIILFGVWISLGPYAPIDLQHIAWKILPTYRYLRIPTRHLILVVFGLSAFSVMGFSFLSGLRIFRKRFVMVVIAGIVLIEMLGFGAHFVKLQPVPESRHDRALIQTLTRDDQPVRLLQNFGVWAPAREALDFDSVMPYGIFSVTGYSPSIYKPYYEFIARSTGIPGEQAMLSHDVQVPYLSVSNGQTMDMLNIKYIIVPPDHDPFAGNNRYRLVTDDVAQQFRLYENTTMLPRFYLSETSCGRAHVDTYTPNRVILTVFTTCDSTLMSSEVWYPGWDAYIDGKKVHIDRSNGVFRTLFVPSGKHTVEYRYAPRIFVLGGLISLLTGYVLLIWRRQSVTAVARASI